MAILGPVTIFLYTHQLHTIYTFTPNLIEFLSMLTLNFLERRRRDGHTRKKPKSHPVSRVGGNKKVLDVTEE